MHICLPGMMFTALSDGRNNRGLQVGDNPGNGESVDDSFYSCQQCTPVQKGDCSYM